MAYIDKIKSGNKLYDIHDKRVDEGGGGGGSGDFNDLILFEMLRKAHPHKIPVYNFELSCEGHLYNDAQITRLLCQSGYDGIVYYLKEAQDDQQQPLLYFTTIPLSLSDGGITAKLLNKDGEVLYTLTAITSFDFMVMYALFDINNIDLSNVVAANIVICVRSEE